MIYSCIYIFLKSKNNIINFFNLKDKNNQIIKFFFNLKI